MKSKVFLVNTKILVVSEKCGGETRTAIALNPSAARSKLKLYSYADIYKKT